MKLPKKLEQPTGWSDNMAFKNTEKINELIDYLSDKEEPIQEWVKWSKKLEKKLEASKGECVGFGSFHIKGGLSCKQCYIPPQQEESRGECLLGEDVTNEGIARVYGNVKDGIVTITRTEYKKDLLSCGCAKGFCSCDPDRVYPPTCCDKCPKTNEAPEDASFAVTSVSKNDYTKPQLKEESPKEDEGGSQYAIEQLAKDLAGDFSISRIERKIREFVSQNHVSKVKIKREIDKLQKSCYEVDGVIDGITALHHLREKL